MNLKEMFEEITIYTEIQSCSKHSDDCVEIADKYAINFVDWLKEEWTHDDRWSKIINTEELLRIYKKEKVL